MSGSGKSVALNTLEDLGFYCVDNLPAELLPDFVRNVTRDAGAPEKLAVGIDVRNRNTDLSNIPEWLSAVGALGLDPRLVFFDTADAVLLKRYAEPRLVPGYWAGHRCRAFSQPVGRRIGLVRNVIS
jgi:UPF0042 nucleotide-binding protein